MDFGFWTTPMDLNNIFGFGFWNFKCFFCFFGFRNLKIVSFLNESLQSLQYYNQFLQKNFREIIYFLEPILYPTSPNEFPELIFFAGFYEITLF